MKRRVANCPACGGHVEFQLSTALVTVCEFCRSVVARADKSVEDHGKVADLVETGSRLSRGDSGTFEKKHFDVVGRVQYQHPAGGVWDEWYLQFPSDRVKWLAEAQGKLYMTVEKKLNPETPLPRFDGLNVGASVALPGGKSLVVTEKGIATTRSAEGDIPWDFRPNAEHRFVDLVGDSGEFATIEYGTESPRFFLGREIFLKELGVPQSDDNASFVTSANTAALQLNCPHCAGALALTVPDQTQRICCPNCHSLLDCQQGKLEYLETLKMKAGEKILLPLGAVGKLFGNEYTVIGFMERFAVYLGKKYPWAEYLLYGPEVGFRWLVCNKGHWSFVEPVTTSASPENTAISLNGVHYRLYDRGIAYVRYVAGEFYWRVTAGEQVETADYIAPPYMLSFERTSTLQGQELNVSRGTYLDVDTLEAAFNQQNLPRPWGIGTIQPLPSRVDVWLICGGLIAVLVVLYSILAKGPTGPEGDGQNFHFVVALVAIIAWPVAMQFVRHACEVNRWSESDYSPYAKGDSDE